MKMIRTMFGYSIKEVEVIRETAKQIVYLSDGREYRESKNSEWHSFHKTKEEAVAYLISQQEGKIRHYERQIEYSKERIEIIKLL